MICFSSVVQANEKTTLIIGHIITQTIQNNNMDHQEVITNEVKSIGHNLVLNFIDNLFQNSSVILDGVSTTIKLDVDSVYKCSLQGDYKNKDCRL